jgi:hypothetical protein
MVLCLAQSGAALAYRNSAPICDPLRHLIAARRPLAVRDAMKRNVPGTGMEESMEI